MENCMAVCPLTVNAMLYGADRPYNIAVVCPNPDNVLQRPEFKGMTVKQILENPATYKQLYDLVAAEMERLFVRYSIKNYERPQKYLIVEEAFTRENHMLTPKLSMKRNVIIDAYKSQIEALYAKPAIKA